MDRNEEPDGWGINGIIPGSGTCVIGCGRSIARRVLMCDTHWNRVPLDLAAQLTRAMNRWKAGIVTLVELRDAQWACVEAVVDPTVQAQVEEFLAGDS